MSNFQAFIEDNFNDDTIDDQISNQHRIIRSAENEIKRLEELRVEQENKPWYQWDGIHFIHVGYSHSDGYRSHRNCQDRFNKYEEFVFEILRNIDPDMRFGHDDNDFYVVSPNGREFDVKVEELRTLPLVKEYFERKELKKSLKKVTKEIDDLNADIERFEKEIQSTDKYTSAYIQSLKEKQDEIKDELRQVTEQHEASADAKRLQELDTILEPIDQKLND